MRYSCIHMATAGVKGLKDHLLVEQHIIACVQTQSAFLWLWHMH